MQHARNLLRRLISFTQRPDFRRNPVRAVYKRLCWRVRWKLSDEPWLLRLPNGMCIIVPQSGSGALIYYQDWSEPEVASFLVRFLESGMTFVDIGAHIGEYVLLAASIVGHRGSVHAFEPDPRNYRLLEYNVHMNRLQSIFLHNCAVHKQNGQVPLALFRERSVSRIALSESGLSDRSCASEVIVPAVTLDTYLAKERVARVDLLKIDVEGAELFVLEGAHELLSQHPKAAPVILFEYSPKNYANYHYEATAITDLLMSYGYTVYLLHRSGEVSEARAIDVPLGRHYNLVASKDESKLVRIKELRTDGGA